VLSEYKAKTFIYINSLKIPTMRKSGLVNTIMGIAFTLTSVAGLSQTQNDTTWAAVNVNVTEIENSAPVENAQLDFKAIEMEGDTIPPDPVTFFTNYEGFSFAEVPVHIDIIILQQEYEQNKQYINKLTAFPNPSSDFNVRVPGEPQTNLKVIDMKRKIVSEVELEYIKDDDYSKAYINLNNLPTGTYILSANGLAAKVITVNTSSAGENPDIKPPLKENNIWDKDYDQKFEEAVNKDFKTWEATYDLNVNADGYYPFDTTITLEEGYNGLLPINLISLPGLPNYQRLGGSVVDSLGYPMENVLVWIKDQQTEELLSQTYTLQDGSFMLPDSVTSGTEIAWVIDGPSNYYDYEGKGYVVPEIETIEDTLNTNFHERIYEKENGVPAYKIVEMSGLSNIEAGLDKVEIYINIDEETGFTPEQKELLWNEIETLNSIINPNAEPLFELSEEELNQNISGYDPYTNPLPVGINISPGTNNTQSNSVTIITPLGNEMIATYRADMTYAGGILALYHELGRALGLQGTSWEGIMDPFASTFTNTDKYIWRLDLSHYRNVYNGVNYTGLQYIVDQATEAKGIDKVKEDVKDKENIYQQADNR
jgi:hypothetical protein